MQVHVIGAGPAGSIAAISAVRNGYDVVLSEEHSCAGIPANCSGLFSKDGLKRLKDFVNSQSLIINPIHGTILTIAGVRLDISCTQPVAFVCNRTKLDQTLAENAAAEGVRVEYNQRVNDKFDSSTIIGADGPFSRTAQYFSFPKITKYASTVRAYINYPCEDPHRVEVYIDNERFPGFFAWVIPQNEELAEFGAGVTPPHSVSKAWQALLKMKNVGYTGTPKGAAIPIRVRKKTSMASNKHRVCLVGDAAGQTKSTTGGGVIFGGQCAMIAGMYANNPWRYETEWKLKHGLELGAHSTVHKYIEKQSNPQLHALGEQLKALQFEKYLSQHGHMDRPLNMLKPLTLLAHFFNVGIHRNK